MWASGGAAIVQSSDGAQPNVQNVQVPAAAYPITANPRSLSREGAAKCSSVLPATRGAGLLARPVRPLLDDFPPLEGSPGMIPRARRADFQ